MEKYKKYKEAFPNKTDAQCIESLCWEVSDKVETIHKLLAEIELLRKPDVSDSDLRFKIEADKSLIYDSKTDKDICMYFDEQIRDWLLDLLNTYVE